VANIKWGRDAQLETHYLAMIEQLKSDNCYETEIITPTELEALPS
jgi:hypothetical protein